MGVISIFTEFSGFSLIQFAERTKLLSSLPEIFCKEDLKLMVLFAVSEMVLSYLIGRYLVNPEHINPEFNLTAFNAANPDFYVPPHPLLYLLYARPLTFLSVALTNLLLPACQAHTVHILILALSVLISPLVKFWYLDGFISRIFFFGVTMFWKVLDWNSILDLLYRAHVLLSSNNVYYWILNYFHFGILGSWPVLRPDLFVEYHEHFCFLWSC